MCLTTARAQNGCSWLPGHPRCPSPALEMVFSLCHLCVIVSSSTLRCWPNVSSPLRLPSQDPKSPHICLQLLGKCGFSVLKFLSLRLGTFHFFFFFFIVEASECSCETNGIFSNDFPPGWLWGNNTYFVSICRGKGIGTLQSEDTVH